MDTGKIKQELYDFYLHGDGERARAFAEKCFAILDEKVCDGMSVAAQKCLQYDVICQQFQPVIFRHNPFFYETGVLTSLSDGAFTAKGYGFCQANGWVYSRNKHLFHDRDPALYARTRAQKLEQLYLICGPYNDINQHYNFNCRPFLTIGLKGVYEKAQAELTRTDDPEEREFLLSVCHGMMTLRKMAEKFSQAAARMLETEQEDACRKNLTLIRDTACRVPWEAPTNLYEALATLAFLRTAMGSLEGAGPNTFGRLDKDLIRFYRADLAKGMTEETAYRLISQFLLLWDCHYDHDMRMEGYADHELENTYTLGGCDDDGEPLYNEITELFLRATLDHTVIFPKIKCRFSKTSPAAYLASVSRAIAGGTTTVLLQNDDATIPAIVRAGRPLAEARDYVVTGCWGIATNQEKYDHGSYLNLLKPFEYAVHDLQENIALVGIDFEVFHGDEDFEALYQKTLRNCDRLLDARLEATRRGGQIFPQVCQFPIFSSTLENCLETHRDFTQNGAKYRDDYLLLFGLPNIVDSLLAIKTLVFDQKQITLSQYLTAVRANWEGFEALRHAAIGCAGWGDGSPDSCALAARFNQDLYRLFQTKTGSYGGKVHMGHLTYTEIRWWGEKTRATPDGRYNGDYFAQGLTPSRLKKIPCVNDVILSLGALDASTMAANSVVNLILPGKLPPDRCAGFLRAIAHTAAQSLQLNCTTREELLDAQKHPEKYPHLIVRVTGFSAKFTSLSPGWQQEILTRNFYE